ncbi:Glycosyltransferase involved in cell wall bisynthesis [bacterium A37T11]|nr:Glycosyltransferase involved in cell wall bisynthesis [bacterium A37T11]
MENAFIVIVGQQAWDTDIGSNCKDIALEFSKRNRVLYVNSPLDRITLIRHKNDPKIRKRINIIKGKELGLVKLSENLWNFFPDCMVESINWIKSPRLFNFFNRYNNRKFAESIKRILNKLGVENFILFNDNEIFKAFYLKDFLKPELSLYYSRDFMIGVDYWKKHGTVLEPLLISKSDVCVANSGFLSAYCQQYNTHSYNVGQGCNLDIFNPEIERLRPADLSNIQGKIIGYVGALQSIRLDEAILLYIAQQQPDWTIVLVGQEDDTYKVSPLHTLKNVIFLGKKPLSDLPAYIQAFDVCINPQMVNEVTEGNYPRKIDEYLAMGKPVVATKTVTMQFFENYVYLAETKQNYIALIKECLLISDKGIALKRRNFALEHSWENSVEKIYEAIRLVY